jgi:hypothetical protein
MRDLKDELYRLLNSAFNMTNIKSRISEIIKELEERNLVDDEVKYTIFLCKTRFS